MRPFPPCTHVRSTRIGADSKTEQVEEFGGNAVGCGVQSSGVSMSRSVGAPVAGSTLSE
jgi:hypothetical protein